MSDLEKIASFLDKHHVLSLATSSEIELSVCSMFYAYNKERKIFIVASNDDTQHIRNINQTNKIAGNIVLETKNIAKIQGVQFRGEFRILQDLELEKLYFKKFPHAKIMMPKLWQIDINYFKMTDNTLGFGKKIIWQDVLE